MLAYHMTGRKVKYPTYKRTAAGTVPILKIDKLSKSGMYHDVSFEVRAGDIIGMIGLLGSGRTELALSLFGLNKPDSGIIEFDSVTKNSVASPAVAKKMGIVLLPEDRLTQGLFLERDVNENISSSIIDALSGRFGFFDRKKEQQFAEDGIKKIKIKTPSIYTRIKNLSGGNQQKTVIEKLILTKPKIFIMDSPTVGIDVGSKSEIYEIIQSLARESMGIILISDEVEEIICNCNKVIVFSKGVMVSVLNEADLAQPEIESRILSLVSQDYIKETQGA
jgi:simple sugar transport system ATP-binding protein